MKSAKEQFEELGYKEIFNNTITVTYKKIYKDRTIVICFYKKHKKIAKFRAGLCLFLQEEKDVAINLKELQAINKQVEELGWK